MEVFKQQRATLKGCITRVETFVHNNEMSNAVEVSEFVTREMYLQKRFEEYCEVQSRIEELDESEGCDREGIDMKYLTVWSKITSIIKRLNNSVGSHVQQPPFQSVSARLPNLNTPVFSGKIEDWQTFSDLFTAVIDSNNSLDDVQKFLYLKGALTGEALNLINDLPLTNNNYNNALDLLKNRYDNKLVVINALLKGMLDTPAITRGSGKQLRVFLTHVKQHLNSLKALKLPVKEWDVLLVFLFTQKLDFQTHKAYELEKNSLQISVSSTALPTLDDFLQFLDNRCVALENIEVEGLRGTASSIKEKHTKQSLLAQEQSTESKQKCLYCNREGHNILKCFKFTALLVSEKRQFVQSNRLCYNCLGKTHGVSQCQIKGCRICNRKHHTVLHQDDVHNNYSSNGQIKGQRTSETKWQGLGQGANNQKNMENTEFKTRNSNTLNQGESQGAFVSTIEDKFLGISHGVDMGIVRDTKMQQAAVSLSRGSKSQVLLATAQVTLITSGVNKVKARALLDSGSQTSFITSRLFQRLKGVNCYTTNVKIGGIANKVTQVNKLVDLTLESQVTSHKIKIQCAVLDKITCQLPHFTVDTNKLNLPLDIKLADPFYYKPSDIDMLISADLYFELILPDTIILGPGLPVLQDTKLGWLIGGSAPIKFVDNGIVCSNDDNRSHLSINLFCDSKGGNINELIPKFWQLEEVNNQRFLSADEKLCEKLFLDSYKRLEKGNFQVNLPMRNNDDYLKLGNSYDLACKRFKSLELRFKRDPELFLQYKNFINEYIELGHGRYVESEVEAGIENHNRIILPHHCVIRAEAVSTKLRVVFDASSKTSTGLSLNDVTLKGFSVQPELFEILCRFRTYAFVLVSDIKQMYRMIKVNPNQRFLQNILWREKPDEPLRTIELQTVTYGTNSAPFLAARCLNQLAIEEQVNYPVASKAILQQCYVDDILCGTNSRADALELKNQLIGLLKSGGFMLHKWCSNDMTLLQSDILINGSGEIDMHDDNYSNKVLGIVWLPRKDIFKVSLPSLENKPLEICTKRMVLSKIAQMFDPMGLVGPVVVVAKIMMQEIWASKLEWDDQLPSSILKKWVTFSENLYKLNKLEIPRRIFGSPDAVEIQIHGFSDASMAAYGACVYIRAIFTDNAVSCHLLCSKSRIAPLNTISLPRLELCAALLLSRLIHKVLSIIDLKINKVYLWTDSSIVLSWLESSPSRWTTFVANRASEVQELTTNCKWNHIKTQENPADHISRGMSTSDILSSNIWWNGPRFLLNSTTILPDSEYPRVESLPEQKKVVLTQIIIEPTIDWSRFSNFNRLQRSIAYCLRFIKRRTTVEPFTCQELRAAALKIIQLVQIEGFQKEIDILRSRSASKGNHYNVQLLIKDSSIKCLNPFIDNEGTLRVNGRLSRADIDYNQKFPILLPAKHHVVKLLIRMEHMKLFHAGPQAVLANLRLRFWIVHGMVEVKSVIKNCTTCYKFKSQTSTQLMGALPLDRVSVARPFLKVGIDFGGPFTIKQSRLRSSTITKGYVALFICMATKAIHIEGVSSLSTDAFVHTLKRFIARRGCPVTIYSDNATNFQGANNELREIYLFFKTQKNLDIIHNFLTTREIEWRFIPPMSPHWGGLWEAGIKSTKFHLRRIVGNIKLTFEEMTTVLAEIEAILNSRPLCPISSDSSDFNCLTPSHFLIGEPLTSYPERNVSDIPDNKLSFWKLCSKIKQNFWRRWSVEYLTRLQNRPKWFNSTKNLTENMIVLLKEDIRW